MFVPSGRGKIGMEQFSGVRSVFDSPDASHDFLDSTAGSSKSGFSRNTAERGNSGTGSEANESFENTAGCQRPRVIDERTGDRE